MMLWLDGQLLPSATARIDPADRGFLLGDGVFETVRLVAGEARHLDRHLARLHAGAAVLGIVLHWTNAEIAAACLQVGDGADGVLRITLTRGPAARGLLAPPGTRATLLITVAPPLPQPAPADAIVAKLTRRNEHSPLARIKSLNYLDSILARQEAAAAGADEAILLNTAGHVAEASAGNLFVHHGAVWTTPPIADGALPGIARALLLEAGFAQQRRLEIRDLNTADALFVSSSLGLRAVKTLNGRVLNIARRPSF